jgi:hypothetical protein
MRIVPGMFIQHSPSSRMGTIKRVNRMRTLLALLLIASMSPLGSVSAAVSSSTSIAADQYVQKGKSLRREIQAIYSKTRSTPWPRGVGPDVTDVVLKYIPVGTSFDVAEAILRGAGCMMGPRPTDIPNPNRPLGPQEPELGRLTLGGWPIATVMGVSLYPVATGDYSAVVKVSASIFVLYS